MKTLKITCAEKGVLINKAFNFDFPAEYTEYEQLSQQEFYTQVHDQDVIIISDLKVDEQILANNPNLKLLALCSTGYDHVNLDLLKAKNIKVCNIRGYAGDAVAEHAFILMMNLIKNFGAQLNAVQNGSWSEGPLSFYLASPIRELKGKTLVILGKGEIGAALAVKAQAFGMNVIFSERKNAADCREGYVSFDQAIEQADILSLHCALNNETREMIDQSILKRMKKDSILINVGRGGLVNNQDILHALENHQLAGFGADVLDQEPPAKDHILLKTNHPNVMLTAHIAWATDEAQERLFSILEDNVNKNMLGQAQNLV
ncbi:NAD(P)-dependent oxidoreductase [Acinetobacter pragensis]|uniref:Hydroxyacid dehydrogenase n=1 Tax=Acinetobacter pragensis TaxID=1806892 RepID=A0A151Y6D0_9GAMM|nr:NAD(P)-dependent oxidoreductase [Acinetobacter pragensis]KYQ73614.1 hydroxyacid dehydrogenase [Acinetobacter pragensis]